jgi:hypothetical protein
MISEISRILASFRPCFSRSAAFKWFVSETSYGRIFLSILDQCLAAHRKTIWRKYAGWLRTVSSTIPSEEGVRSVIQHKYYHNFRFFRNTAIYQIIMSKSRKWPDDQLFLAA